MRCLLQYIEALRRCKMGARLAEARAAFHAAFPLTEALWCAACIAARRGMHAAARALTVLHACVAGCCANEQQTCPNQTLCRFDWLSDEIDGLGDASDIPRIEGLMEAAVGDYLSIPLWVQHLE